MILLWSGKDYYELLEDAAQQKIMKLLIWVYPYLHVNFFIELETSTLGYLLVLDFGKLCKIEPDGTNFIFDIL